MIFEYQLTCLLISSDHLLFFNCIKACFIVGIKRPYHPVNCLMKIFLLNSVAELQIMIFFINFTD